jgi:hypothetical protein
MNVLKSALRQRRKSYIDQHETIDVINEEATRKSAICLGCGDGKGTDMIVCWECFKRGVEPYKYFGGSFCDWLRHLNDKNLLGG